ncbi:MAG: glutathione S-transferase N-terminal domain-containing protein [Proteobacteria bacterium]|nr:glutathione S-transferase N-terminal domain-containing protein [Pseudomonadota bacterium]
MTVRLYELAGDADDRLFSPYCWRARLALAHKGIAHETIPWRFTEKDAIAFSGQGMVPVLQDGAREVHDSWAIALYLEETYPDRPALFEGPQARALAYTLKTWVERSVQPQIFRAIMPDLYAHLHARDQAYFRESREKRFGMTLEQFGADPRGAITALRTALDPARLAVAAEPFLCGAAPAFADYMLFGAFQWARVMSPAQLLEPGDPLCAWRERMLDLYGGLARKARGYPV